MFGGGAGAAGGGGGGSGAGAGIVPGRVWGRVRDGATPNFAKACVDVYVHVGGRVCSCAGARVHAWVYVYMTSFRTLRLPFDVVVLRRSASLRAARYVSTAHLKEALRLELLSERALAVSTGEGPLAAAASVSGGPAKEEAAPAAIPPWLVMSSWRPSLAGDEGAGAGRASRARAAAL